MTDFHPLIGSGFDALAAQDQFWSGFSKQIEEGNMARATAAQDKANQYAMNYSQALRSDAAQEAQRQDASSQAAAHAARSKEMFDQQRADQNYQFGVTTSEKKRNDDLISEGNKFAEKQKVDKEEKATAAAEDVASSLAPQAQDTAAKRDAARERAQAAEVEATTIKAKLMSEMSGYADFDRIQKMFVPKHVNDPTTNLPNEVKNEENRVKALEANSRMAEAQAQFQTASEDFNKHATAFEAIRNQVKPYQLLLNDDGTIHYPRTKKNYGGEPKETAPPVDAAETPVKPIYQWQPNEFSKWGDAHPAPKTMWQTAKTAFSWSPPPDTGVQHDNPVPQVVTSTTRTARVPSNDAVSYLLKHPEAKSFFDETYGARASEKYLNSPPAQEPDPALAPKPAAPTPMLAQSSKTIPLDSPEFDPAPNRNQDVFTWFGDRLNPSKAERLKLAQEKYPGAKIVKVPGGMVDTFNGRQWQEDQYVVQLP
jgi:hypothetical protein